MDSTLLQLPDEGALLWPKHEATGKLESQDARVEPHISRLGDEVALDP
jgi:hypothetical protein